MSENEQEKKKETDEEVKEDLQVIATDPDPAGPWQHPGDRDRSRTRFDKAFSGRRALCQLLWGGADGQRQRR